MTTDTVLPRPRAAEPPVEFRLTADDLPPIPDELPAELPDEPGAEPPADPVALRERVRRLACEVHQQAVYANLLAQSPAGFSLTRPMATLRALSEELWAAAVAHARASEPTPSRAPVRHTRRRPGPTGR